MPGKYPDKIKSLPLFDGRFDPCKLETKNSEILFASYPPGTSIPPHTHTTDNHGVITRGELFFTMDGTTTKIDQRFLKHSAEFEVETDEIEFWFNENT